MPPSSPAAIVTGAAGGIGRAIATHFLDEGIDVLTVDQSEVGHVRSSTGRAVTLAADLTTRAGNRSAVGAALEEFGRLDVVVACAGFQHVDPIDEFPEDRWDDLIAILLTSPFLLAKYAWPALVAAPQGGRFIVIASAHSLVASPFKSAYIAAKHGVLGLVKTLALEGAQHEVMATAICPGYVRTPLVERQIASQAKAHGIPEERVLHDIILASQPGKRLIEPEEVAAVAAFLVGSTGRSFSGVPVTMDQGWTAR